MRRNVILVAVLAIGLVGCGNFRDLFSAHADLAAEAGGQQLTAQRLAQIVSSGGKGVTDQPGDGGLRRQRLGGLRAVRPGRGAGQAAGRLGQRGRGRVAGDLRAQGHPLARHAHDPSGGRSDAARRQPVPGSGRARAAAHPVRRAGQRLAERQGRRQEEGRGRRSPVFGRAPRSIRSPVELSEDPGSKADSGFLPPSPKGRFVPAFDSVGWTLGPGQVSGVVETPFGYHIIKRPSKDEARSRFGRLSPGEGGRAVGLALHGQPGDRQQDPGGLRRGDEHAAGVGCARRAQELDRGPGPLHRGPAHREGLPPLGPRAAAAVHRAAQVRRRLDAHQVRQDPDPERAADPRRGPEQDHDHPRGVGRAQAALREPARHAQDGDGPPERRRA